jgi:hypothetical protein
MSHQDNPQGEQQRGALPVGEPMHNESHPGCKERDGGHANQDDSPKWSPFEKTMALFTGIIALCTLIYMIFAGLQWNEIRKGSSDTHALAEAALISANTAKESFDLTRHQAENTMEAICQVNFGFSEETPPSWTAQLINEGKVVAKSFKLHAEFSRMSLPDKRTISHSQAYDFSDVPELFPTIDPTSPRLFLRQISLIGDAKPNIAALNDTREAEIARYSLSYDNGFGIVVTRKECVAHLKSPYFDTTNHWRRVPCEKLDMELSSIEARRKAIEKSQGQK